MYKIDSQLILLAEKKENIIERITSNERDITNYYKQEEDVLFNKELEEDIVELKDSMVNLSGLIDNMENIELKDKLISINRITKVVKGGRRFAFSALVVVGNFAGSIGIGHAKSKQVPDAIKKATQSAKKNLFKIPLREGRTLHHDVLSKDGAGKVLLRSAPSGTGIIAGGPIRAACEVLGIKDIVGKSLGSSNPLNVLRACMKGLKSQNSPKHVAVIRGKNISEITKKKQ